MKALEHGQVFNFNFFQKVPVDVDVAGICDKIGSSSCQTKKYHYCQLDQQRK